MSEEERRIPRPQTPLERGFSGLALWLMCGLVFGVLFTQAEMTWGLFAAVFGGLLAVLFVAFAIINVRHMRRFMRENNEAIATLARGEHQRAHDVFWRWAAHARVPIVAGIANHNVACSLVRLGKLQHALDIYTHNDKTYARALKAAALYPTSAADLALTHALAGNLADAEAWLARADERAQLPSQPSFPILCVYARAVLDCRTGKAGDAARVLDEKWAEAEALLTGDNLRPLRVVRAFAHAVSDTRSAGIAESLLATSKPVYAGEYQHLGAAWPEMQQFLAANNLV